MTALAGPLAAFAAALEGARDDSPGGAEMAVIVAHPDDETIGLGGHLRRLRRAAIVHVTDGAPRNGHDAARAGFATLAHYAAARRRELAAAMREAGIGEGSLIALGLADQTAASGIAAIVRRLRDLVAERRPHFLLTHPFEGGHPDHDATALAVRAACDSIGAGAPAIIEMASYHLGAAGLAFQRFVPDGPELAVPLGPDQAAIKRRMLACHATQAQTLRPVTTGAERFRLAPRYDFTRLPNCGRLYYETWPSGMTGTRWLALAAAAMRELGPAGA